MDKLAEGFREHMEKKRRTRESELPKMPREDLEDVSGKIASRIREKRIARGIETIEASGTIESDIQTDAEQISESNVDESKEELEKSTETAVQEVFQGVRERIRLKHDSIEREYENRTIGEIKSKEELDQAIQQHPDVELSKYFEEEYERSTGGLEQGKKTGLTEKLEELERRRLYEAEHGGPPDVKIDSMDDIDKLAEKHSISPSEEQRKQCETYFSVLSQPEKYQRELAEEHQVARSTIGNYRDGREPQFASYLRKHEEERIIEDWARGLSEDEIRRIESINEPPEIESIESRNENSVRRFEQSDVDKTLSELGKELTPENMSGVLEELYKKHSSKETDVYYADISKYKDFEKALRENRADVEEMLKERLGLDPKERDVRVGVVDGRVYTWTPNLDPDDMINAWSGSYYYMDDKRLVDVTKGVSDKLGLDGSLHDNLKHLRGLSKQMMPEVQAAPIRFDGENSRVGGKMLHFKRDTLGLETKDFEGHISKITGPNGQAGIRNPRFPTGEELDVLRSRLTATVASDGNLKPSGRISYDESNLDRIERVEDTLRGFGDIDLHKVRRRGTYEMIFPAEVGQALKHWGMTPGSKAMNNPGLPECVVNGSEKARRAYLEDLIPEDGTFNPKSGFYWSRSHALHAGKDTERYGFESDIGDKEIGLVKDHGNPNKKVVDQRNLSMGKLREFSESEDLSIAHAAKKLEKSVQENRNNLIDDEVRIAESLGYGITISPVEVSYYPKTQRVSVKWAASTTTKEDAIQWGIENPPNDTKKREEVENWLRKLAEEWLGGS
ncbi:MAG: hypothetical protein RTU92_00865 [Candidatus Thorarchaeota archaeon]